MSSSKTNSKIWTIIRHEFLTKVKSKGFIISTILGPLIMVAFIGIIVLITYLSKDSTDKKIAVLDKTTLKLDSKIVNIDKSKYLYSDTKSEDILQDEVLKEKIDGYLVIPMDFLETGIATVYTRGGGGLGFVGNIDRIMSDFLRRERLLKNGTDTNVIRLVEQGAEIQTRKVTQKGTQKGTEKDYTEVYAGLGYFLGFFIYFMMLMYGSIVMRSVIEEKANRIIEVIASSVKPKEIMLGKVIGIGSLGLSQVLIWVGASVILMAVAGPIISSFMPSQQTMTQGMNIAVQPKMPFDIPNISISIYVAFIFYFLSGYFIYSMMFAAIGSAVDQETDAQQLQTIVMLPIILPIFFMTAIITNPDGTLAIILSLIPFFAPILMIVRIAATQVPIWQIVLSVLLILGTFFGLLWSAAKIYRTGILMYGKKPKLGDIIKWLRLAK